MRERRPADDELVRADDRPRHRADLPEDPFAPRRTRCSRVEDLSTPSGTVRRSVADRCARARSSALPGWSAPASRRSCAPASGSSRSASGTVVLKGEDVTGSRPRDAHGPRLLLPAAGPARRRADDDALVPREHRAALAGPAAVLAWRLSRPRRRNGERRQASPSGSTCSRRASTAPSIISPAATSRRCCSPRASAGRSTSSSSTSRRSGSTSAHGRRSTPSSATSARRARRSCSISSDLPEILHLNHRAYVLYRGRIQAELAGAEITEENVLRHFFERQAA